MGALRVGDVIFDACGKPTNVVGVSEVFHGHDCFEVVFSDGTSLVADAEHLWEVDDCPGVKRGIKILTTREIASTFKHGRRNRYAIDLAKKLDLPDLHLPVDPYSLGAWLGDGNSVSAQITGHVHDLEEIAGYIRAAGHTVITRRIDFRTDHVWNAMIDPKEKGARYCIRGHDTESVGRSPRGMCRKCASEHSMKFASGRPLSPILDRPKRFSELLASIGVLGNKHIPQMFLRGSIQQRLALMQGLMDTDGYIDVTGKRAEFCTASASLRDGFLELAWSLGLKPSVYRATSSCAYRVSFVCYSDVPIFRLKRKAARLPSREGKRVSETTRRRIVDVRHVPSVPTRCILVDNPRHLFLAGRAMVPTHNTEAGLNWAGHVMATQAVPMLCVQPTVDTGELWSKQRLQAMIDATPALRARVMPSRSRDSGNTTRLKEFPGGLLRIGGANSSADLASMPIRYLFLDEVDRYPTDLDDEGDPVSIAEARTTTFVRRKIFLSSTPTIESLSRINREWTASNQQRYHVPCPHCGEKQHLQWDNLRWPEGKPLEAKYACEHCGMLIEESYKGAMLAAGEWVAAFPDRAVLGFHISGLYTPPGLGLTWVELASEFEKKKRDPLQFKVFQNVRLGECSADPEEKLDWEELKHRGEPYALRTLPRGCLVLTAGIDVQKDRLAVQVRGWGRSGTCWTIDWLELPGDPTQGAVWDELEAYLTEPCINAAGLPVRISRAAIDAGYLTDDVLAFTRRHERRGWFAVKGVTTARQVIAKPSKVDLRRNGVTHKGGASMWPVGVDSAKERLFARLSADGKHALATERQERFSDALPDEYYAQLTAEIYDPHKRRWIKQRVRNEALDTAVYATAASMHPALRLHLWSDAKWTEIERALDPANGDLFAAPAQPAPVPPKSTPAPQIAPGSGRPSAGKLISKLA